MAPEDTGVADEGIRAQQLKWLEMLEAVITRMADNQFKLRAWGVGLGSAIIGFAAKDNNPRVALLALLPALTFWLLDAYYLALEEKFRDKCAKAPTDQKTAPRFELKITDWKVTDPLPKLVRPGVFLVYVPVLALALIVGLVPWPK